jgi:threonine/homoserine/homoserine lactone efflux protein
MRNPKGTPYLPCQGKHPYPECPTWKKLMVDPLAFATYSFVMSITPGPNNVMLTASGATFGFRRTVPHMLGVCAGFSFQLLAVCAGLGVIFTQWPELQTVLKWGGAGYLVYMGWRMLRSGEANAAQSVRPLTFAHSTAPPLLRFLGEALRAAA